jgi:hypothetical protein
MDNTQNDTSPGTPPASNNDTGAPPPEVKIDRGTKVTFYARRAGGDVTRFAGTIKALAKKAQAGETIEFEFEGQARTAEGIRRGAGEADAPCWAPA